MIPADIHARLAALGVEVLLPEQIELPLSGGRPGEPSGIRAFLAQHPDGYVQIEEPYAVSTDGMAATFWIAVASIALTPTRAQELGLQVDRSLCGLPYAPEPYKQTSPAEPTLLQTGVWLYRPTYERKTFIGLLAGG